MSETLATILRDVLARLQVHATTYLPSLIAALIVILGALIAAVVVRRIIYRIFKGATIDRFLRRTGLAHLIDPSGHLRATRVASETAYWSILIIGILAGLSVFGTDLTANLIQSFVFLIPRLVISMLILLGGAWLSQYLARCTLVWAFNEDLPHPRRFATGVRVLVLFVAAVVAADQMDFARSVFLTAFVILVGGLVLTLSLALGIGASGRVREYLHEDRKRKTSKEEKEERSLWTHL
jgi:hypothetical protein